MNIYVGTLGELVIVEIFVFIIWLRVLIDASTAEAATISSKRLLLTSVGLVFNAFAITGIMVIRAFQLKAGLTPFIWPITVLYSVLAVGNILFIVAASLGQSPRLIKAFVVITVLWSIYVMFASYF